MPQIMPCIKPGLALARSVPVKPLHLHIHLFDRPQRMMSMSFLSRSSIQMACGQNTILRMQMDYLADSGLAVAKIALLNPQEWDTAADGYWRGENSFQIGAGDQHQGAGFDHYHPDH